MPKPNDSNYTPEHDQLLIELREKRLTYHEIAAKFFRGWSTAALQERYRFLQKERAGPSEPAPKPGDSNYTPEHDQLLIELGEKGLSWKQIAAESFPGWTMLELRDRYMLLQRERAGPRVYTPEQNQLLIELREKGLSWKKIAAESFPGWTMVELRDRYKLLQKERAGPTVYTPEQNQLIKKLRDEEYLLWGEIRKYFPGLTWAELKDHYETNLREETQKSRPLTVYTPEEDHLLIRLKEEENLPWKEIAKRFPGRTQAALQLHYSQKLKGRSRP